MAAKTKLQALADALESNMEVQAELEAQLAPYKEQEEELRAEICEELVKRGLQYVKTTSGLGYGLVKGRVTFAIKKGMEDAGIKWALEAYPSILTVSAAKLNKVVQPMMELPEFIERKEGEPHLSVRTTEE
jgi:hypothetical protein